jgi:hypothetical protein
MEFVTADDEVVVLSCDQHGERHPSHSSVHR